MKWFAIFCVAVCSVGCAAPGTASVRHSLAQAREDYRKALSVTSSQIDEVAQVSAESLNAVQCVAEKVESIEAKIDAITAVQADDKDSDILNQLQDVQSAVVGLTEFQIAPLTESQIREIVASVVAEKLDGLTVTKSVPAKPTPVAMAPMATPASAPISSTCVNGVCYPASSYAQPARYGLFGRLKK